MDDEMLHIPGSHKNDKGVKEDWNEPEGKEKMIPKLSIRLTSKNGGSEEKEYEKNRLRMNGDPTSEPTTASTEPAPDQSATPALATHDASIDGITDDNSNDQGLSNMPYGLAAGPPPIMKRTKRSDREEEDEEEAYEESPEASSASTEEYESEASEEDSTPDDDIYADGETYGRTRARRQSPMRGGDQLKRKAETYFQPYKTSAPTIMGGRPTLMPIPSMTLTAGEQQSMGAYVGIPGVTMLPAGHPASQSVSMAAHVSKSMQSQGNESLTPEQLHEMAKDTIAKLAAVQAPPAGAKLPILLPRSAINPSSSNGPNEVPPAIAARQAELKNSITNMLLNPTLRTALLSKLRANVAVGHGGHLGAGIQLAPKRSHGSSKPKSRHSVQVDAEAIATTRPRRTPKKAVDYSTFFKDEEDDDEFLESSDDDVSKGKESPSGKSPMTLNDKLMSSRRVHSHLRERRAASPSGTHTPTESTTSSDELSIEKILSHRILDNGEEEFMVKFNGLSYRHTEWISKEELLQQRNGGTRISRFLSKPLSQRHFDRRNIFNPEFTQIERIVHGWEHPNAEDPTKMTASYLVKWRGLPYAEATWEKKETIEEDEEGMLKLEEFKRQPTINQKRENMCPIGRRPDPNSWKELPESPIYKDNNVLRSYQLEGLNWLVYCWHHKQSSIVADEMGLGKTVQSVGFLELLQKRFKVPGPFIVIAPLSTIPHWEREFAAWTNMDVLTYHGSQASRDLMFEYEFFYKNERDEPLPGPCRFDVLLTTYEMALAGFMHLRDVVWRVAVFDEAHRLKNKASKAAETLKALQIEHKLLLTGTPLQNNLEELWSLLNFLQPQRFFSEEVFLADFGGLTKSEDVAKLQALLKPLMLRRLKEDVETSIPVKEETIIEVELTSIQKRYYRAILERNFAFLTRGAKGANAPNLVNTMMELRKCCIHPYLIKGAEDRIVDEIRAHEFAQEEPMNLLIQASGKLVLVDKLLKKLREGGHRVLLFSQMTRCLDILSDYLRYRHYPFERIDGSVRGEARQAAIDRFCDLEQDAFVFLLCTRAGGVGINLTAADTVVIFDSDWNPQNDLQAQARCHRIGQTKSVKIYRLITRNTYEREMFDRAGLKLGLDRAVLQKMGPLEDGHDGRPQLSKREIETLLKKGAYGILMESDEASRRFCEEDIDQILERRTQVVRHDSNAQTTSNGTGANSIFSKASFAATADDFDIDIDDPNFWELWAQKQNLDPRAILSSSGVVMDEARIRRQVRRLKNEDVSVSEDESIIDEPSGEEKKMSINESNEPPFLWTDSQRRRFYELLMKFGLGRTEAIQSYFPARSRNDLIACTRALLKFCTGLGAEDDTKFKEDNEKLLLSRVGFDTIERKQPTDLAAETLEAESIEVNSDSVVDHSPALESTTIDENDHVPITKADIPYPAASKRQIAEFRSFLRTQTSEKFQEFMGKKARRFVMRMQLLEMVKSVVETAENARDFVVEDEIEESEESDSGDSVDGKKKTSPPRKPTGGPVLQLIPNIPQLFGAAPSEWWGRNEDQSLMVGIYRHGYGNYKAMQADQSLSFFTHQDLPDTSEMNKRLRKLLISIEKRNMTAAKLALHSLHGKRRRDKGANDSDDAEEYEADDLDDEDRAVNRRGPSGRLAVAGDEPKLPRWSKPEKQEFIRVIGFYGLPEIHPDTGLRDWKMFRELGFFEKRTDEAMDEYADTFIKLCKIASERPSNRRRSRSLKAKNSIDGDDLSSDDPMDTDGSEGMAARVKLAAQSEDEEYNAPQHVKAATQQIPAERARKALSKIDMFTRLRQQVLLREDLDKVLRRARRSGGLPKWWITGEHDSAFLKGVARYGLTRPDLAIGDPELPFWKIYCDHASKNSDSNSKAELSAMDSKGSDKADALEITPELIAWPHESIAVRRAEYLVELVASFDTVSNKKQKKSKLKSKSRSPRKQRPAQSSLEDVSDANAGADAEETGEPTETGPAALKTSTPRKRIRVADLDALKPRSAAAPTMKSSGRSRRQRTLFDVKANAVKRSHAKAPLDPDSVNDGLENWTKGAEQAIHENE